MAGSESEVSPKKQGFHTNVDLLGDWIAPLIVFVVLGGLLLALLEVLLGSAE